MSIAVFDLLHSMCEYKQFFIENSFIPYSFITFDPTNRRNFIKKIVIRRFVSWLKSMESNGFVIVTRYYVTITIANSYIAIVPIVDSQ